MKYQDSPTGFLLVPGTVSIILSLIFICVQHTHAQQTVTSATLSGHIEDGSGAVVSGASLTATNQETNQKQTATTDHEGRYRFPYLQVGSYKLTIEAHIRTRNDSERDVWTTNAGIRSETVSVWPEVKLLRQTRCQT